MQDIPVIEMHCPTMRPTGRDKLGKNCVALSLAKDVAALLPSCSIRNSVKEVRASIDYIQLIK